MTLGHDKGAVALAVFHPFKHLLSLLALHDVLKRVFLDVAYNPLLMTAVAGRNVAPRVNKEEVGECTASRAIITLVATQAAVNGAVEIGPPVIFQAVLEAAAFAGEQRLDKEFMLLESLIAFNLVVVLVEIPAVVNGRVSQLHIEGNAEFIKREKSL